MCAAYMVMVSLLFEKYIYISPPLSLSLSLSLEEFVLENIVHEIT